MSTDDTPLPDISFTFVIPTKGRLSVMSTLDSLIPQLVSGDEVVIERLDGAFGGAARNKGMRRASGTHLLFMDDDDIYLPGAIKQVREAVAEAPERLHFFGMVQPPNLPLYSAPKPECCRIGTPMFCVPNVPKKLGRWPGEHMSDWNFIRDTHEMFGEDAICHKITICHVRPS